MEPWQTTVENLLGKNTNSSYCADDVIKFITSHLRPPYNSNQHPVFTRWRPVFHKQDIKFTATIHCEAALASLAKYAHLVPTEQINGNVDLIGLLQVMF
jgi:hypothetical protein